MCPFQYPRYTSAVKDGRPWVAQRLTKLRSTTGTRQEHDPQQKGNSADLRGKSLNNILIVVKVSILLHVKMLNVQGGRNKMFLDVR